MSKKKRGAPEGNQNAAIGGEENDGQLLVRLPRGRIPRAKAITHITGDRGLNALVRRLLDAELDRIEGIKIAGTLDHAKALAVLQEAGQECPAIPEGANTAVLWFETAEGEPAVAVNQTGFAPEAADNEDQVNGCLVLVAQGRVSPEEGRRVLEQAIKRLSA